MIESDDDPVGNRDNFKFGLFYYNPDDDRMLIHIPGTYKRYIFNYAQWPVYITIVPVLLVVVYAVCDALFFRK